MPEKIFSKKHRSETREITTIFGDEKTLLCKCDDDLEKVWTCLVHGLVGMYGRIWLLGRKAEKNIPVSYNASNASEVFK